MLTLAFYKAQDHLFNRLVSWWTDGPYSHVEVVLSEGDGKYFCLSSSVRDGGVRLKWMTLPPDRWDIVEVPGFGPQHGYDWYDKHSNKTYDLLGLFGFFVKRGTEDSDKFFCSEVVADICRLKNPWRYDPNSLYDVITSEFWGVR